MKRITTEIEIKAEARTVWDILMDFEKYPEWNGFFKKVSGQAIVGKKLHNIIDMKNGKSMTFKPVVLEVSPEKCFRWIGKIGIPYIFDGEHQFIIETIEPGRVKFIHQELFKGILVPMMWSQLSNETPDGFRRFNKGLKERADAQ